MSTETSRDPDWHIQIAGAGIVTGLVITAFLLSVHWWPGFCGAVVVELLLARWMIRNW